jgi:hypothetical protein
VIILSDWRSMATQIGGTNLTEQRQHTSLSIPAHNKANITRYVGHGRKTYGQAESTEPYRNR